MAAEPALAVAAEVELLEQAACILVRLEPTEFPCMRYGPSNGEDAENRRLLTRRLILQLPRSTSASKDQYISGTQELQ